MTTKRASARRFIHLLQNSDLQTERRNQPKESRRTEAKDQPITETMLSILYRRNPAKSTHVSKHLSPRTQAIDSKSPVFQRFERFLVQRFGSRGSLVRIQSP